MSGYSSLQSSHQVEKEVVAEAHEVAAGARVRAGATAGVEAGTGIGAEAGAGAGAEAGDEAGAGALHASRRQS